MGEREPTHNSLNTHTQQEKVHNFTTIVQVMQSSTRQNNSQDCMCMVSYLIHITVVQVQCESWLGGPWHSSSGRNLRGCKVQLRMRGVIQLHDTNSEVARVVVVPGKRENA